MLQVILVGYGFAGEIHARVYKSKPDCNLLAIVEKDQSKFDAIRKDHPETKIFSEIKNALSVLPQEVMVDLCVPPPEYFSICELCREKNMALPLIEWVTIIQLPLQDKDPGHQDGNRLHWQTALCCGSLCCEP